MKMMPRNICLTLLAALALCMVACTGRHAYPRQLQEADSLADHCPDSALVLLRAYEDSARHINRADSMYLALLKIKATDKLYIPRDTTDGILDIVSYYEHGGDRRLLPMAYYYLASAYRDCGKPLSAVNIFYKAQYSAEENDDSMTQARCFSQIGTLFCSNGLYGRATANFHLAYKIDSLLGDTHRMAFGLRDIASCYMESGNYDISTKYFIKALDIAQKNKDIDAISTISAQFARLHRNIGNYPEAEKYLKVAIAYGDSAERSSVLSIASGLYRNMGREADAKRYDEMVVTVGNYAGKRASSDNLWRYFSSIGQTDSAIHYFNLYKSYTDTINNMRANDLLSAKATLNESIYRQNEKSHNRPNIIYLTAIITLAALLILAITLLYKRRKNDYAETKSGLATPQHQSDQPQNEIPDETRPDANEQLATDPIVVKFKRMGAFTKSIGHDTKEKPTKEDWVALDLSVNAAHHGFRQKLTELGATAQEYKVCLLIKIGVPLSDIARILFKERATISIMRKRMFVKFFDKDGSGSDFDSFIRSL